MSNDPTPPASLNIPFIGMLATVRNRRGIISSVQPYDGLGEKRLHLITVEYTDTEGTLEDQLIWELEPNSRLLEPTALPKPTQDRPMPTDEFDALVRSTRWTAMAPYVDPDGSGPLRRLPIASPFYSAVQIEDFQLVPLLKSLRMPRIALLLADDVGLGKTIEAGLILCELLLRRRVRRVLVLCPASLRLQWRQEMQEKFSLSFDIVDREQTHALRKQIGLDANPWRTYQRIIASYHYLKQPDVLEQFLTACRSESSAQLSWDLLIIDEAHNLTPAPFGEESQLSKLLGALAPHFEHKLFLTATPHNGHTRSFSGLLERLDPVRFSRSDELSPSERSRVQDVVIRRLKRDINRASSQPRFAERNLAAVHLPLSSEEHDLSDTFQQFRRKVYALTASGTRGEQVAGAFAIEVLGKRLLSCPVAFADSWHRYQRGMLGNDPATVDEVMAARKAVQDDTSDDKEVESRTSHAARTVGAWLKPLAEHLQVEAEKVQSALERLGLHRTDVLAVELDPHQDARFDALCSWIEQNLCTEAGQWKPDERLIVFTEYKTTLDYLHRRLTSRYRGEGLIRVLYGGAMNDEDREAIKTAFNDPADPVRILVATDAASEGLNLQETARFLLHFDVPWNPARLEQRNGRLDRHGQARDVVVYHFATDDDADLAFLSYVVNKIHTIREDLGSCGEVFDAAFQRRFIQGEATEFILTDLERQTRKAQETTAVAHDLAADKAVDTGEDEAARVRALAEELDLDAETLKDTLEVALGIGFGRPRFDAPDERGRLRLRQPIPTDWQGLVDDVLRVGTTGKLRGAIPALVFDASYFITQVNGRPVFRPSRDTVLLHLGHPFFHRALATFARARFPGADKGISATRWTVRRGHVPNGAEALVLVTVEELAVNELRETFHHWVRTIALPVDRGELGPPLPHQPAHAYRCPPSTISEGDVEAAREIWDDIFQDLSRLIRTRADELTQHLKATLESEKATATIAERERFLSRQGELSDLIRHQTLERLERQISELQRRQMQPTLFDVGWNLEELARNQQEKEEELKRRRRHYEELREQLQRERKRILENVIPNRHALRGTAQVFPVAVEIRLPN